MFKIYDGRDYFYQWDINRKLIVNDESIKQVHFCNRTGECSLVCETYKEDNKLVVDVPNILLQQDWKIRAYAYDGNATLHEKLYDVKARTKPDNYVYTETEVLNYENLKERVDQIEENGVSDETVAKAVEDYLKEHDITVDLTGYATEKYVDDAITAIPEVDLTEYAKKSEIPSTTGLATVSYVDEKFNSVGIDLTGYATEVYVNQEIAKAQLSGGDVDLTGYATEKYVDDAISNIELTPGEKGDKGDPGYTPVKGVDYFDGAPGKDGEPGKDGSDYVLTDADKQEIAGMVEVSGGSEDGNCIYVGDTEPTDDSLVWINPNGEADEIITMEQVETAIEEALKDIDVDVDLTGYATEEYVNTAIGNLDIPEAEVDLSGYYTKEEIDNMLSNLPVGDIPSGEEVEF